MTSTSSTAPRFRLPPVPALLLAAVSIQGGAALAKTLFPAFGPPAVASLRVLLAAIILAGIWRPRLHQVSRAGWLALVPYGVALGIMNLTYYLSLERIPLALAVTLEFVGPLGVAVLASRRALDFVWVALAAAGLLCIVPWPGAAAATRLDPVGMALALTAGVCWGIYIWAGGRVAQVFSGPQGVSVGMCIAALTTVPFGVVLGTQHGAWSHLSLPALLTALGVAILSSALPYSLEMNALRVLPARVFGILMSLEPAVAAVIGLIFLNEHLRGLQWLAIACVMLASVGVTLTGAKKAEAAVEV
ncbi:DMT family transporter [Deinococcus sp. KNUC1210]|uniref:EamA family transporter n=1 Tax=Deinococcus sp. KNUC1210 TaxID=2917691 RepID=UPI001EF10D9A|nr:DMT family transporter [Deinococcus sp. KNUC1210]ULH15768.1 DMT family transporter [Deinococcus sp. KNUC1210]